MIRKFLLPAILFLTSFSITAQVEIVSADLVSSITKEQLKATYTVFNFISDVDAYRVTYTSVDVHGAADTLSGLIALPTDPGYIYPRLAYMHGTVDGRLDVPSEMSGEGSLTMAYAGMGSIAVAPDYPGLGTGRGFHPYVHVQSQSRSGIDLLRASLTLADEKEVQHNDGLLITGYSQGGHGALGLQKVIEEQFASEFTVSASGPMSGPYSLSDIMLNFVLDGNIYNFPGYLPNTVVSMQTAYGNIYNSLDEVFQEAYVGEIQKYLDEEIGLFDLNDFLINKLTELEGGSFAVKIFQPEMIDSLEANPDHPLLVALKDNDLVDWAPQAPTRLYYCTGDDQVNFNNSLLAEEGLQAAGGVDVKAIQAGGIIFNHGACFSPAAVASSNFLLSYQELEVIPSAINEEYLSEAITTFPNPVSDYLAIQSADDNLSGATITLFNSTGQRVLSDYSVQAADQLNVGRLASGVYLMQILDRDGNLIFREKVIKQ